MRLNISTIKMRMEYAYIQNINNFVSSAPTNTTGGLIYIDQAGEVLLDSMTILYVFCNISSCPTTCNGRMIYYNSNFPINVTISNSVLYCNSTSNFILYQNFENAAINIPQFYQGSAIYLNSQNSELNFKSISNDIEQCTVAQKGGAIRIEVSSIQVKTDIQIYGTSFYQNYGIYGGSIFCSFCNFTLFQKNSFSFSRANLGGDLYILNPPSKSLSFDSNMHYSGYTNQSQGIVMYLAVNDSSILTSDTFQLNFTNKLQYGEFLYTSQYTNFYQVYLTTNTNVQINVEDFVFYLTFPQLFQTVSTLTQAQANSLQQSHNLTMINTTFSTMAAYTNPSIIAVSNKFYQSFVVIDKCSFENNSYSGAGYGGMFKLAAREINNVVVTNTRFYNLYTQTNGSAFYMVGNSNFLQMSGGCSISTSYATQYGGFAYLNGSKTQQVVINETTILTDIVIGSSHFLHLEGFNTIVQLLQGTSLSSSKSYGKGQIYTLASNSSSIVVDNAVINQTNSSLGGTLLNVPSASYVSIVVNSSQFSFSNSATQGGLIYSSAASYTEISINNSTFINISATSNGGIIYSSSQGTQAVTINNSSIYNFTSGGLGGAGYFITKGTASLGVNASRMVNASAKTNGTFFYMATQSPNSANPQVNLLLQNSDFNTTSVGIWNSDFPKTYNSVISILSNSSSPNITNQLAFAFQNNLNIIFTSAKNRYCNSYVKNNGSFLSLYPQTTFNDTGSKFIGNAAIYGGVVYCQSCIANFSGTTFQDSLGMFGGVFLIENQANVQLYDIEVINANSLTHGGFIYIRQTLDQLQTPARLLIAGTLSQVTWTQAQISGGFINLNHSALEFSMSNIIVNGSSAPISGGTISIMNISTISLSYLQVVNTSSSLGSFLNSNLSTLSLQISNSQISCLSSAQLQQAQALGLMNQVKATLIELNNTILINSKQNTFSNCQQQQYGAIFKLSNVNTLYDEYSSFYNNKAAQGGVLYLQSCPSVLFNGTIFDGNLANYGGTIYQNYNVSLTFFNINLKSSTSIYDGGFMYSQNTRSSDFIDINFSGDINYISNCWSINGNGGCFYVDSPTLNFVMTSTNQIQNLTAGGAGGLLYSKNSTTIQLRNQNIQNISASSQGGKLIYSESPVTAIVLDSVTVDCFDDRTQTETLTVGVSDQNSGELIYTKGSVFQVLGSQPGVLTRALKISNCRNAQNGSVFNLQNTNLTDLGGSQFFNNQAKRGGVIFCQNCSLIATNISFLNGSSQLGASIYVSLNANISIQGLKAVSNFASVQGGVIHSSETDSSSQASQINITGTIYLNNNTASSSGGCFYFDNLLLSVYIDPLLDGDILSGIIQNSGSQAFNGGVFFIQQLNQLQIANLKMENISVSGNKNGAFIYSAFNQVNLTLENITVNCNSSSQSVSFGSISQGGSLYFEQMSLPISAKNISIQNCFNALQGGAFSVISSQLDLLQASLAKNDARTGGAIFCYNCILNLNSVAFNGNSAYQGGTFSFLNSIVSHKFENISISNSRAYGDIAQGGAIYLQSSSSNSASTLRFSNLSVEQTSSNFQGGFIYVDFPFLDLFMDNISITGAQASQGGVIYLNSLNSITLTSPGSYENFQASSSGSFLQSVSPDTAYNISILNLTCQSNISVPISYGASNIDIVNGQLLLLEQVQVRNCFSNTTGGLFKLQSVLETKILNSTFVNLYSRVSGGFGYFKNSQVQVTSSIFDKIYGSTGGVLHLVDSSETKIINSKFSNIDTSLGGGIIYTSQSSNIQIYDDSFNTLNPFNIYILNCSFQNLSSNSISSGFFLTSLYMSTLTLEDVSFKNFSSVGSGGLFFITAIRDSVIITTSDPQKQNTFSDFSYQGLSFVNTFGSLFYSTASLLKLQIKHSLFQCSSRPPNFSDISTAIVIQSIGQFAISNAISVYSELNTYRYCFGAAKGSIFNLQMTTFQDVGSQIYENSGNLGGAIAAVSSIVSLNLTTFRQNYALQGSVFYMLDNTTLHTYKTSIYNNQALRQGGVIYSENIDYGNFDSSTYSFVSSSFQNNSASSGTGGFIYLDNLLASVQIKDSQIQNHYASQRGGLAFILNGKDFLILNSELENIEAFDSAIIFSQSPDLRLFINSTSITCDDEYSQNSIIKSLEELNPQYNSLGTFVIYFAQVLNLYKSSFQKCGVTSNGGLFYVVLSNLTDYYSEFQSLSSLSGGVIVMTQGNLFLQGSKFHDNLAILAGVIYLSGNSYLNIKNSLFYNNQAFGESGVLYIESGSYADISATQIYNNQAEKSSFLSVLQSSSTSNVTISNCDIYNNVAQANTISVVRGSLLVVASTFTNNMAFSSSKNIFAGFSSVYISQTSFKGVSSLDKASDSTLGSFIFVILDVQLYVTSSSFFQGYSQYGGAIYVSGEANVQMSGCYFSQNEAKLSGGAIYASGFNQVQINKNSNFVNNIAQDKGDDFYISNSQGFLNLFNSKISNPEATLSIYAEQVSLNFTSLQMNDIATLNSKQSYGSALWCANCYQVHIKQSSFKRLKSILGGAFYFFENTQNKIDLSSQTAFLFKYLIESTDFSQISAVNGGALYLDNIQQVKIFNCDFNSNIAQNSTISDDSSEGAGGAIYFECLSTDLNCNLIIAGSTSFQNNYASIKGGAIHWSMIEPEVEKTVKFQNNTAGVYGQDYSCFSQNIALINQSTYQQVLRKFGEASQDSPRILQSISSQVANQRSGGTIPPIYLCLVDKYGQIVTIDSTSKVRVSVNQQLASQYIQHSFQPVIDGSQVFQIDYGVVYTSDIIFSATPGYSYSLVFSSDGIDSTKPSNKAYIENMASGDNYFQLQVDLRLCEIGEQYTSIGQCQTCPAGTSYSVSQMNTPGNCKDCPTDKAVCYGGSNIGPKAGFWRSSNTSDDFIDCQYYYACLGMMAPDYNPQGSCLEGYQGIICADCAAGYSRSTDYKCSQCPSDLTNFMRLIMIFFAVLIFVGIIVYTTLSGARQAKNVTTIFIKIMMNHFQLIFLTASFNLSWPQMVLNFFNTMKPVAQISQQVFSFDCFIDSRTQGQINDQDQNEELTFRIFYIKLVLYSVAPLGVIVLSIAFWVLFYKITRNKSDPKNKIATTIIILLFLIHPTLTQYFFSDFDCITIDENLRLQNDLQILCYQKVHKFFSFFVAIPSLAIWGLGIPLTALSLLEKYKHKLNTLSVKEKLGFLYRGYRKEFYYWEIWIMFRKIGLVSVQVFVGIFGTTAKALAVLFLLAVSIVANLKARPFSTEDLNDLESISLLASLITIYCGIFYLSNVTPKVIQKLPQLETIALQLSASTMTFLFTVIILANVVFFGYWSYKMYIEIKYRLMGKWPRFYMAVCSCGSKTAFNRVKLEIQIKDENESLKEKFTKIINRMLEMHSSGKLVLNEKNIEKLQVYLRKEQLVQLLEGGPSQKWKVQDILKEKYKGKRQLRGKRMSIHKQRTGALNKIGKTHINIDEIFNEVQGKTTINSNLKFSLATKKRNSYSLADESSSSKTKAIEFSSESSQTDEESFKYPGFLEMAQKQKTIYNMRIKQNSIHDLKDNKPRHSILKQGNHFTPDKKYLHLGTPQEINVHPEKLSLTKGVMSAELPKKISFYFNQDYSSFGDLARNRKTSDQEFAEKHKIDPKINCTPTIQGENLEQINSFDSNEDRSYESTMRDLEFFQSTNRTNKNLVDSEATDQIKASKIQNNKRIIQLKNIGSSSRKQSEASSYQERSNLDIEVVKVQGYRKNQNKAKQRVRQRTDKDYPKKSLNSANIQMKVDKQNEFKKILDKCQNTIILDEYVNQKSVESLSDFQDIQIDMNAAQDQAFQWSESNILSQSNSKLNKGDMTRQKTGALVINDLEKRDTLLNLQDKDFEERVPPNNFNFEDFMSSEQEDPYSSIERSLNEQL